MLTLTELQRFSGPHGRLLGEIELACVNKMLAAGATFYAAIMVAARKGARIADAHGCCS